MKSSKGIRNILSTMIGKANRTEMLLLLSVFLAAQTTTAFTPQFANVNNGKAVDFGNVNTLIHQDVEKAFSSTNYERKSRVVLSSSYLDNLGSSEDDDSDDKSEEESTSDAGAEEIAEIKDEVEEAVVEASSDEVVDDDSEEDFSEPEADVTMIMSDILTIAASSGRGEFATSDQKDIVGELVERLEEFSTSSSSGTNPLYGTWELVYSSTQLFRSSPLFMAGRAVCKTDKQAQQYDWFCDMHRAALAISNIGAVRQIISPTRLVSEFEVKVGSVPFVGNLLPKKSYSGGLPVTIDGAIVSSADIISMDDYSLELLMDTVEIKGSNVPVLRKVLDMDNVKLSSRSLGNFLEEKVSGYTNPKPQFETTYLTNKYRINRDQDGKIFIYTKVSDSTEGTDYSSVDSDLGFKSLLEGFRSSVLGA